MLYKKGSYAIKINWTGEYGIKPSLWIYNSNTNTYVKVATFQNIERTEMFRQYLEYLLFPDSKEPKEVQE